MRTTTRAVVVVATGLIAVTAGCSSTGDHHSASTSTPASRTIAVTMTDNAFQPATFRVTRGETVTFTFNNDGAATHEAVIGDEAAQLRHHGQMTGSTAPMDHHDQMPGGTTPMAHGYGGGGGEDAVTVAPGSSGSLTHTFTETGTYLIGCHEPGHWESGMKATVEVT